MEFTVPAGFTPIPIGLSADEAHRNMAARVAEDLPATRPAVFQHMVRTLHRTSQALEESGALYAGTCVRAYEGELSLATLLVTVQPFSYADADVAAKGIVHALVAARGEAWAGSVFDTPCGPVAVLSGERSMTLPTDGTAPAEDIVLPLTEMQALLPVPPGREAPEPCLVAVNFSTPCGEHWDAYCADLVELLRSMSFDPPQAASDSAVTDDRPVSAPRPPRTGTGPESLPTPFG